jgi:hypothetical protein
LKSWHLASATSAQHSHFLDTPTVLQHAYTKMRLKLLQHPYLHEVLSGLLITMVHSPVPGAQRSSLQLLGGSGHVTLIRSHFIVALLKT